MANIKTYKELIVWQKAHELVLRIYEVTATYPKSESYCLVSQMRRAAISVAANIVEGFRRRTLKDSLNFYHTADASLEELKYYILVSENLRYTNKDVYNNLVNLSEEVGRLLTRWIQSQIKFVKA